LPLRRSIAQAPHELTAAARERPCPTCAASQFFAHRVKDVPWETPTRSALFCLLPEPQAIASDELTVVLAEALSLLRRGRHQLLAIRHPVLYSFSSVARKLLDKRLAVRDHGCFPPLAFLPNIRVALGGMEAIEGIWRAGDQALAIPEEKANIPLVCGLSLSRSVAGAPDLKGIPIIHGCASFLVVY
jgi:hypothetical protein